MNKKIVMGSIGAAIILILVSFTTVIAFQSTDSSKVAFSPLFKVRSKRAIDTENNDNIIFNYIGMGKKGIIPISTLDSKSLQLQKNLNKIFSMGKYDFNRFVDYFINIYKLGNSDAAKVKVEFQYLKDNPDLLDNIINNDNSKLFLNEITSSPDGSWYPGCLLIVIIRDLINLIADLSFFILTLITMFFKCIPPTFRLC